MRLLLVEDDPDVAFATERRLATRGHRSRLVDSGAAALRAVEREGFDAILLDLGLPDADGLEVLGALVRCDPSSKVIVITGRDDASSAVTALRSGAVDYVVKPAPGELLDHALARVEQAGVLSRRLESIDRRAPDPDFLGEAPAFRRALDRLRAAATSPRTPVLIRGESGTGKEHAAARIHAWSERASAPFVAVNVAALPPSMLEAELFGYEAGAFTGAAEAKRGLFELADGGVLFLDEIGELQPEVQPKLLRVIEGHPFRRLGSEREMRCDVRLVTATHRDLVAEVAAGRFRRDLYHRIQVIEVRLPPLRERPGDVELLASYFLARLAREMARPRPTLSVEAARRLDAYAWPGNVRELRNVLESALVLGRGEGIDVGDLPPHVGAAGRVPLAPPTAPRPTADRSAAGADGHGAQLATLDEAMRRHVERVVDACGGNLTHAAERLGISRGTLRRRRRAWQQAAQAMPLGPATGAPTGSE